MSHNIGQMFYVGKTPWHGLGNRLDEPATLAEALIAGGLDWRVEVAPLALANEPESRAPQRVAIVREGILPGALGRVLGVTHVGFKPLQNREGAEIFDSLLGKGGRVYHTGGYLKYGEVVWLLARLPHDIRLPGDDVLNTYLLFSNSHDGSLPIDIRLTTVRVVCNNTLTIALKHRAQGSVFRRGHGSTSRLVREEAEEFFESVLQQHKETAVTMTALAKHPCSDDEFAAFLTRLLPSPTMPTTAGSKPAVKKGYETRLRVIEKKREEVMHVHTEGHSVRGRPGSRVAPAGKTWWGGLNSVTAWADHVAINDSDYSQVLFGAGSQLKTVAYERIVAETGGSR